MQYFVLARVLDASRHLPWRCLEVKDRVEDACDCSDRFMARNPRHETSVVAENALSDTLRDLYRRQSEGTRAFAPGIVEGHVREAAT